MFCNRNICRFMSDEKEITVPTPQPEEELNPEIQLPTDKVTVINVNEIKDNSILIVKIDVPSPMHKMAVAPTFAKLLSPYGPKLREKNVTVMLMLATESIDIISEEEMNRAGWEKKEKSLIIKPFQKS